MEFLAYAAIVGGLAILAVIGLVKWLRPEREPEAVIEECTIVDGAKACTRRPVDTVDDLPPEARAVVESADTAD